MSWQFILKIAVTVAVVVAVSEIARRSSFWGAMLASLPLTSLMAFVWIYAETGDAQTVAILSRGIFWLVLASLPLFALLPVMLGSGWSFWPSLALACTLTAGAYFALLWVLQRVGFQF